MRIAYLDCFSGISGDMFLGALVDAGVPAALLEQTVAALGLGAKLEFSRVVRGGIAATKVDVRLAAEQNIPHEASHDQSASKYSHTHAHSHEPDHGRGMAEIREIIQKAAISAAAKATAIRIFEALAAAEAEIHNTSIEQVHFHEVGAVDALVDIVCAAVGAEALAVDEWVCSPLNVGGGTVKCAHGTLPVPAPATVKLLNDAPVYSLGPQVELVTPTGAAIVKTFATRFGTFPAMKIDHAGYGAGSREFVDYPNVLRLTVGESMPAAQARISSSASAAESEMEHVAEDRIAILEANLDDLSPQVLAYAMERLLAEGALDVFSVPVQMKKNRAGALLTVLAKPADADRLTKVMFAETTTLGVRRRDEHRRVLARRWETVETEWGPVRIKVANMNGTVSNYAPEFEDCRQIATKHHVPLKKVMEAALRKYGAMGS
ncbi:MAG: nickel pincer cofactor biosynthesis protein LarC [Terriglobales bacterium]